MASSKIRVLDEHTINKIAAGEVIENPASVIKELVENSIDAGSTEICVEIKVGGRQLIRVSDNGCGMSSDDAILCLERHATSKIKDVEDIQEIITMGFRGEAIPSIASVSKFTLLTTPRTEDEKNHQGTLIMVEGGRILSSSSAARSVGTTIEVKSLFYNVPVRRKFQKSPDYDTQEIVKMLSFVSLGNPSVKFELISDQKQLLITSLLPSDHTFQEKLSQRIESIFGEDFLSNLIPISLQKDQFHLEGFIGSPTTHRSNRLGQYLFINKRAVQSSLISFAIREGYGTMLPNNRHPIFVLHLNIPGSYVDVNVHPQKKEVRLRKEQQLKEMIVQSVQKAIQKDNFIVDPLPEASYPSPAPLVNTYESLIKPLEELPPPNQYFTPVRKVEHKEASPIMVVQSDPLLKKETIQQSSFDFPTKKVNVHILKTLPGYIVIDLSSLQFSNLKLPTTGLGVVHQKAAYARIYYERLLNQKNENALQKTSQPLLLPITIEFSLLESTVLKSYINLLNQLGFSIREFGDQTFMIDALPNFLEKEEIQSYLLDLIHELREFNSTNFIEKEIHKQLAIAACRHTRSANKCLNHLEAQHVLEQLFSCQNPLQCPVGKPTIVCLNQENFSKLF